METPNVATAKTKKSAPKKEAEEEVVELTKEEKMMLAFSESVQDLMFEYGLYEGCNKMIGVIFNEVSRKYNDMDAKIMEVCGALEMARGSILKIKANHKEEPKAKE